MLGLSEPAQRDESGAFTVTPSPSEVVQARRPAGEVPAAERASALKDASLRASRAPAIEIIARLSSERTKLKAELSRLQKEKDALAAQFSPMKEKLSFYEDRQERLALDLAERDAASGTLKALRAELAARDAEIEARDVSHEELARLALAHIRETRQALEGRTNELQAFRKALAERDEEVATLRADMEARESELATARADLATYDSQFDALRAEAREEIGNLRNEVDARDTAIATLRLERAPLEAEVAEAARLRATLEQGNVHEVEVAALRATLDERTAELEGLRSALEIANAPCAHESELAELRTQLEAEIVRRAEAFEQHAAEKDELHRLRRRCAELEAETAQASALDVDLRAAMAALEAKAREAEELRQQLTAVPAPSVKALAIGFGTASVIVPQKKTRRFDDLEAHARPYPALEPKAARAAARVERALRRFDRRFSRLEKLLAKPRFEKTPEPSSPSPRNPGAGRGAATATKGGGFLAGLIQANLALRAGAGSQEQPKRGGNPS